MIRCGWAEIIVGFSIGPIDFGSIRTSSLEESTPPALDPLRHPVSALYIFDYRSDVGSYSTRAGEARDIVQIRFLWIPGPDPPLPGIDAIYGVRRHRSHQIQLGICGNSIGI
jgi:hypothetical protein